MSKDSKFQIKNFYECDSVKCYDKKKHNPNYSQHGIKLPFRMIVVGSSGTGKTNIVTNLLNYMTNTFNHIVIMSKNLDEPLYKYIEHELKTKTDQNIVFYEGLDWLNSIDLDDYFGDKGQSLVIIDDMVLESEKDQEPIKQLSIRGRKIGDGVSLVYLSQSFFGVLKKIRDQATIILLRSIVNQKDISALIKTCSNIEKEDLMKVYNECVTDSITDFLTIDLTRKPSELFRRNFNS